MKPFAFTKRQLKPNGFDKSLTPESGSRRLLSLFQTKRQRAIGTGAKVLSALSEDLEEGWHDHFHDRCRHLDSLFDVVELANCGVELIGRDKPPLTEETAVSEYLLSSWFLSECSAYLTSQLDGYERLHLVTGIKVSLKQRTLERMVKVALAKRSAIGALADQKSLQEALVNMEEWGHSLYGLFHSHPGRGVRATLPSSIDLETQRRYENGGYPLIGAIFTVDGLVRFFGHHPSTITIFGKGVTKIDDDLFTICQLPH